MPNRGIDGDIQRAKELRAQAKLIKDAVAKDRLEAAAIRLERRAGKKAMKVGKPKSTVATSRTGRL